MFIAAERPFPPYGPVGGPSPVPSGHGFGFPPNSHMNLHLSPPPQPHMSEPGPNGPLMRPSPFGGLRPADSGVPPLRVNGGDLIDMEDPFFYMMPSYIPECQAVVMTSQLLERMSPVEATQWLDQQLSLRQCPYPIRSIDFTFNGDTVVQFVTRIAKEKAMSRGPLKWGQLDIGIRNCTESDISSLFWVGISGATPDLYPLIKQALHPYGEVRGEYAPHPNGIEKGCNMPPCMLKLYFAPNLKRRLPPVLHVSRPNRPKGFPSVPLRLYTPHGPLTPKCADFGPNHSPFGCPECFHRRNFGA